MATLAATDLRPRRLVIEHLSITIEGRALEDVQLGGWVYGPELGTAPVVVIVGGITASPFPFGDGAGRGRRSARGVVAGAVRARPDRSREAHRALPVVAGQRLDVERASTIRARSSRSRSPDSPTWWRRGSMAAAARRRSPGSARASAAWSAWRSRRAMPERCAKLIAISGGLRPDGWGTATRHLQRELVRDGLRNGDVATGMSRARQLGMLTYRGRDELDTRFGKLAAGSRSAAGRRVSRSPRPAVRGAVSGQDVPAAERGHRSRLAGRPAGHARGDPADQRRNDGRRRARRHAVSVGAAGGAAPRAAGRRRRLVVVEAGVGVRPRRVPRRPGQAGRRAARRAGVWRRAAAGGAAALRGRRRRAGARDPHRPGRLRHGGPRRARDDRAPARGGGRPLRRQVPRVADRGARPDQGSRTARRRHPDQRSARSNW